MEACNIKASGYEVGLLAAKLTDEHWTNLLLYYLTWRYNIVKKKKKKKTDDHTAGTFLNCSISNSQQGFGSIAFGARLLTQLMLPVVVNNILSLV